MKKCVLALFILVIGASLFTFIPVHAIAAPDGLSISPTHQELTIPKGISYTSTLTVGNNTSQVLRIDMYAEAFTVANDSYDYTFLQNSALNQWIRFPQPSLTLQPHTTQAVSYTIAVPTTGTPGGKYFSLFAATSSPATQKAISVSERVGSLLYVTVPGDVSYTGKLLGLNVPIIAFSPIEWSEKIDNTGANYFTSTYTVSLKDVWGKTISQNRGSALIISSSIRLLSGQLGAPTWLGLYKVTAQFSLGDNGTQVDGRWLLYLPLPQLFILLALIAVVVSILVRRRHQNKNKTA